jgi:energy-converting hydrogenase Eha subunit C
MVKAADALVEAGYDVRVVSARYLDWAWEAMALDSCQL